MASARVRHESPSVAEDRALSGVLSELNVLLGWLGTLYGVSLPLPELSSLSSLKGFLAEPLTPGSAHPWARLVLPLKLKDRLSILGTLFLFRKRIPVLVPPSLSAYQRKLLEPSPPPDPEFLRFISYEMKSMFPQGWDRGWKGKVLSTTLSPSSVIESSRRRGGAIGVLERQEWVDRELFCSVLIDRYSSFRPNVDRVRLAVARTDGKDRVVGINSVDHFSLSPYHRLVYDRVAQQPWCLRGEAKPSRFSDFTTVRGEVFVSGDYESATDNLNVHVQRHILNCFNRTCARVPLWVREASGRLLEAKLVGPLGQTDVNSGQLMGNFLSFPLLCLSNYLTFRYLVRRPVPVKINGDDIVFRSTPQEFDRWSDGVVKCGLTLSKGKTAVSNRWFSLNSTFFVSGTKKVSSAPVVRSTAFFKPVDSTDLLSLTGRWSTLAAFGGGRRRFLQVQFLRMHSGKLWKSQRSLRRGWAWSVSEAVLREARMLDRERFYSSLPAKSDSPIPVVDKGYFRTSIPEGFRKEWVRTGRDSADFGPALVASCWDPKVNFGRKEVDVLSGTFRYCASSVSRFRARLLGVNLKSLRGFLRRSPCPLLDTRRKKGYWVWRKECEEDDLRRRPLQFTAGGFR